MLSPSPTRHRVSLSLGLSLSLNRCPLAVHQPLYCGLCPVRDALHIRQFLSGAESVIVQRQIVLRCASSVVVFQVC